MSCYDEILDRWEAERLRERHKSFENYPTVCIMGEVTYLEFLSALRHKYDGLLTFTTTETAGMEYQGVRIYWTRAMERGCIFGGPRPE